MADSTGKPQRVRWGRNDAKPAGITTEDDHQGFVAWDQLKSEVEKHLLTQVPVIPAGSIVTTADFHGRTDWIVRIIDPRGNEVGHVWFGGDPYSGWRHDGYVRLGTAKSETEHIVWSVFQRYSDGTYKEIHKYQ
ncbi:MAG TPA: hypothetical protein VE422_30935 [Terriglobia bacterium]|nr:hypothetical protein [Terriglobia bacterium]